MEINTESRWEINFTIPIYNFKIKLVLCENVKDYILDNNLFEESDQCKAIVLDFDNDDTVEYNCMVIFSCLEVKGDLITHEAFHILCLIMRSRGFTLSESSEETCAYLIGYLYKILTLNLIKLKQLKNGGTGTREEATTPVIRS